MAPKWLEWAKELQALSQAGIAYSKDPYDIERFERIRLLSAEIMVSYTDVDDQKLRDLFCNERGYQTPKVDVRGVVVKDEAILLVKEKLDGKWSLPGGWADVGLSAKENVIKEMREEAGLIVKANKLIAVLDRNKHNYPISAYGIYKIFIHCQVISGKFEENTETAESGYFTLDHLPELSTGRVTKEQIKMCIDGVRAANDWEVIVD